MSRGLATADARRLVEARLGRPPQDMLEAAVVLESWVGISAPQALALGRAVLRSVRADPAPSVGHVPPPAQPRGVAVEAAAFLVAVVAIGGWASPLAGSVGTEAVERALLLALPLTMALQWGLSSRYLSHPDGLAHLSHDPLVLLVTGALVAIVPTLVLGLAGAAACLLTLTWTGGAIVIRRGWSIPYAAAVVLAAVAMHGGAWPPAVLALVASGTTLATALAVLTSGGRPAHPPGRWDRTAVAATIGLGIGLVLVVDRTVSWSLGPVPAVALVPSTLACFWAGAYLWQFQRVIPEVLAGVPVVEAGGRALGGGPLRILLGAIIRLVVATSVLSALLVGGAAAVDAEVSGVSVLAAFGAVALATLLVGLLESVGRGGWALLAVAAGVAGSSLATLGSGPDVAGGGVVLGAALAVLVALPAAIGVLRDPVLTLSTRLGIP